MRRVNRNMTIGAVLVVAALIAAMLPTSPVSAVIGGRTDSITEAVGAIVQITPETETLPDGTEVQPWALCSATLIHAEWALTDAGCVVEGSALFRFADGEIAFEELLFSQGRMVDGEPAPDQYLYTSFGDTDVRADIQVLLAHFIVDGPDIPNYSGSFVRTGLPIINPEIRSKSFVEGSIDEFLGATALVPLGEPAAVEPVAYSADPDWPSRHTPAIFSGFGTTQPPGNTYDAGLRRSVITTLRSGMSPPVEGDPTDFCESTQYILGETLCARPVGWEGSAACFGDTGGPVIVFRDEQMVAVSLIGGQWAFPAVECGEAGALDRTYALSPAADWIAGVTGVQGVAEGACGDPAGGTGHVLFDVPCWSPGDTHPFIDVHSKPEPYFADPGIAFLFANQITTGVSATSYEPDSPVTRGDLATLLHRFVEVSASGLPPHPFVDVVRDYHQIPVAWMYESQLTTGSPAGSLTFKADDGVTRAEMVTFLWRLIGSPDVPLRARFIDVASKGSDYFAVVAIAWAADAGITTGSPAGSRFFRPDALVTRAEVATFLARFAEGL